MSKIALIFFHAYGGCKEEIVGLALNLANPNFDCYVFDMPGHGENPGLFNVMNIAKFIKNILKIVKKYESYYFIGHSIGARIALSVGAEKVVAISPPGEILFEGRQSELMQTIRVRRVKEVLPFEGLKSALSSYGNISDDIREGLVLYAKNDIISVRNMVSDLSKRKIFTVKRVDAASHLDIVTARQTIEEVKEFIWI